MVLINYVYASITRKELQVSVPLRGLWFLSYKAMNEGDENGECFRPLAGIMVLISRTQSPEPRPLARFRPLAGIMVLITRDFS